MSDTSPPHHLLTSDLSVPAFMSLFSDDPACFVGCFWSFSKRRRFRFQPLTVFSLFSFLFVVVSIWVSSGPSQSESGSFAFVVKGGECGDVFHELWWWLGWRFCVVVVMWFVSVGVCCGGGAVVEF
jgi:hypothetical protein